MTQAYDLDQCYTAGELRSRGYNFPEVVPDCAWVPRDSVVFKIEDWKAEVQDGVIVLLYSIGAYFFEPFRWISAEFFVESVKT
ncbi:hypothetical protein FDI24_gp206 [Acidovorax phage ACP17]|uniref:Uncharacterized protein n=1 Tax=Acidovorax phage ACP17 TaxID=2010329 RepID=A0A218M367_9CAUD|nr:hypothetical protein FDI24_gp206 [Acidovorax phage ACP17]ASD50487.1 hypothetical protein [Acidovorax phage ACP17]